MCTQPEYRVWAPVGVEHTLSVAMLFGQISLHHLPVAGFRPRFGAGAFRCASLKEIQCLAEPATGGMHCQVDRPGTGCGRKALNGNIPVIGNRERTTFGKGAVYRQNHTFPFSHGHKIRAMRRNMIGSTPVPFHGWAARCGRPGKPRDPDKYRSNESRARIRSVLQEGRERGQPGVSPI